MTVAERAGFTPENGLPGEWVKSLPEEVSKSMAQLYEEMEKQENEYELKGVEII